MFIALDESFDGDFTTVGCVCLPIAKLPELEGKHISIRLEQKLWGEIKWNALTDNYLEKYLAIIKGYLLEPEVTFHSWTYKKPTRIEVTKYWDGDEGSIIYKQAYRLLRSVIRKCLKRGTREPFYIVPDHTDHGNEEYRLTKTLLSRDPIIEPHPEIEFCAPGSSQVCGALQIADFCSGAVQYKYDSRPVKNKVTADKAIETLTELNKGISIVNQELRIPSLYQFKLHHYFCPS